MEKGVGITVEREEKYLKNLNGADFSYGCFGYCTNAKSFQNIWGY
ncbi:ABC transporter, ATP-binding protein [Bacillus cereus BGSC 6E1]|nr:ABC transporter, ATP-binding protein [Bacillus cereus BGSC 6E1]